jgi:hypothetical protein
MRTHNKGKRDNASSGGRASDGSGNGRIVTMVLFGAALLTFGWIVLLAWGALELVHKLGL